MGLDTYIHSPLFYFHRIGADLVLVVVEAGACQKGEGPLMKGAGDFGFALFAGAAGHAAGQGHLLFMRAQVLRGIPLPSAGEMEDGDLVVSVADAGASVRGDIFYPASQEPYPPAPWRGSVFIRIISMLLRYFFRHIL